MKLREIEVFEKMSRGRYGKFNDRWRKIKKNIKISR